tara:strand:+ start:169 stop:435 length:267 start_codon:yes stop_codon:yes gene_type:complete
MKHKHTFNKIIQLILKDIAKENGYSPQKVIQDFASGSMEFVVEFWQKIYAIYGEQYNDVYRCPGCKKFELDFVEHNGSIADFLEDEKH